MKTLTLLLFACSCALACGSGYSECYPITFTNDPALMGSVDIPNYTALVTQANFPSRALAVAGSGGQVQNTTAQTGGGASITVPADLIFATDSTCEIKVAGWEFETYNAATGAMNAWVNIGTLTTASHATVTACVGKSSVTTWQGNVNATWTNCGAIYHYPDGGVLGANDSCSGGYNGTITAATAAAGQVDGAANFNGSSAKIVSGTTSLNLSYNQNYTISAWVRPAFDSTSSTTFSIFSFDTAGSLRTFLAWAGAGWGWYSDIVSPSNSGYYYTAPNTPAFSANTTHLLTLVNTSNGLRQYYWDGSPVTTGQSLSGAPTAINYPITVGYAGVNNTWWSGLLDEVEINMTAFTADRITAAYHNQLSPGTFYTIPNSIPASPSITVKKSIVFE